ncbi:unnamed protein product [Ambrosiozyma monospora]|uniref:Unnamed protein product n=1 Tax=Ambrosiozyma monospora TaxID=43982 RepID=A0A9W6YXJ1_AMBMO|nr:unnamed protein product [Ambrosiozyma monospora]
MSESEPRGILKNAPQQAQYKIEEANYIDPSSAEFDRKKVIENTKLNSKLAAESSAKGDLIRAKIQEKKRRASLSASAVEDDHLKWDEKNILLNEQEKSATMVIDEPKTPYEGGFDPNNEYYREDNEEDDDESALDDLSLGEALVDTKSASPSGKGRIEVVQQEEPEEEEEQPEEEERELSREEKHRLFELKRKQHYHLKGSVLHRAVQVDEEDIDEELNAK